MKPAAKLRLEIGPGLAFQLDHLPERLVSRVADYLSYYIGRSGSRTSQSLRIDAEPPPPDTAPPPGPPLLTEPPLTVRRAGEITFFELPEILSWCDPRGGHGGIRLNAPSDRDLDEFIYLALVPMIIELALGRNWIGLHAAALSFDGKGILLPGPSGAGKSTIFRKAHRLGCGVLSDDLVWLRRDKGEFRIRAFPRGLRQDQIPAPTVDEVGLGMIACPKIVDRSDCILHPISMMEVLSSLLREAGFLSGGALYGNRFRALVRMARSVPGYRLEAGHDRTAAPRALARLASELE
jgi:hypothetical protein